MQVHKYGWKPSPEDPRDLHAHLDDLPVADEVDPRARMPPIVDQGDLGSCTSNAVESAIRFDRMLDGHPHTAPMSRLFLYYCERKLEGSLGDGDTGAYGRDGFKAAVKWGLCTESEWPYVIDRFEDEPPPDAWRHAAEHHKLRKEYVAVPQSQVAIKQALTNNQTVAFGFSVFESFESQEAADTGIVPVPGASEVELGGHEVLIVGYLGDYPDYALCRNSWGKGWGQAGYFLMPWEYLLDPFLADDFRTIRRPIS